MTDKKCVICQKVINTGEKFNLEGEEDYTHIECDLKVNFQNRLPDSDAPSSTPERRERLYPILTSTTPEMSNSQPKYTMNSFDGKSSQERFLVYVVGLTEVLDENAVKDFLKNSIETLMKVQLETLVCHSDLGVCEIYLKDENDRQQLLNSKEKLQKSIGNKFMNVNITDRIQIDSYLVFPEEKNDEIISEEEVFDGLSTYIMHGDDLACEKTLIQLPNIYKITCKSIQKYKTLLEFKQIKIKNYSAQFYAAAECWFVRGLPESTNEDNIRTSILQNIPSRQRSTSKIFVQIISKIGWACFITPKLNYDILDRIDVEIGNQTFPALKVLLLSCSSDSRKIDIDQILEYEEFRNVSYLYKKESARIIIGIKDIHLFERFLRPRKIEKDGTVFNVEIFNPEEGDLVAIESYRDTGKSILEGLQVLREKFAKVPRESNSKREDFQEKNDTPKSRDYSKTIHDETHQSKIMSATIAALKSQGYTINGKQIKLNLNENLKTVVYQHTSTVIPMNKLKFDKPRLSQTNVEIINEDSIKIYEMHMKNFESPLLIHTVDAQQPNFEQDLVIRSDYCRNRVTEMEKLPHLKTDRFYCSSEGELKAFTDATEPYPIPPFGGISTSHLTFFRYSKECSFEFMTKPIYDVSCLAVTNFSLEMLPMEIRRKISNMFAIAYREDHDSLVIPIVNIDWQKKRHKELASLFFSVIDQYAGFFEAVTFVVPEDILDIYKSAILPIVHRCPNMKIANIQVGPFRVLQDGNSFNDITIWEKEPCRYGIKCGKIFDERHTTDFEHPGLCYRMVCNGECELRQDPIHQISYVHEISTGTRDTLVKREENNRKKAGSKSIILRTYDSDENDSVSSSSDHRLKSNSVEQKNRFDREDREDNPSEIPRCQQEVHCTQFHNEKHWKKYRHPFKQPCPNTPYQCEMYGEFVHDLQKTKVNSTVLRHCAEFTHVCLFGRNCTEKNKEHWQNTLHIARNRCPYDLQCSKLHDEEHLNSFNHPTIRDIRVKCRFGTACIHQADAEHVKRYQHPRWFEEKTAIPYYNFNRKIDFAHNHQQTLHRIILYGKKNKCELSSITDIPDDILRWIRTVQPVYRCRSEVFQSILAIGEITSSITHKTNLKSSSSDQREVPRILAQSFIGRPNAENNSRFERRALSSESNVDVDSQEFSDDEDDHNQMIFNEYSRGNRSDLPNENDTSQSFEQENESQLKRELGVDKTVTTFLGPQMGKNLKDIVIVLKREILHHPDSSFTMQSARSYINGKTFIDRPWLSPDPKDIQGRIETYHNTKFCTWMPGYDTAAALELMALTSIHLKKHLVGVTLKEIQEYLLSVDSVSNIEVQLPETIPLYYVDYVYILADAWSKISDHDKRKTQEIFKSRFKVVEKSRLESLGKLAAVTGKLVNSVIGTVTSTEFLRDSQAEVANHLFEKFLHNARNKYINLLNGITLTLKAGKEIETYDLPITIKQALKESSHLRRDSPSKNKYFVYWQTIGGDMMLSLSNKPLDDVNSLTNINCLTCYVTSKPLSIDPSSYKEQFTYVNNSAPNEHAKVCMDSSLSSKSARFLVGCNRTDFISLCLEVEMSTGTVRLSHVGPNSLYNTEKITKNFDTSLFKLDNLNYISISTNNQCVHVRNLFISTDKIDDLHPTCDNNFDWTGHKKSLNTTSSHEANIDDDDHHHNVKNQKDSSNNRADEEARKPCRDNVNCLIQYAEDKKKEHNQIYSHPCGFSELCRKQEKHLTHEKHPARLCTDDKNCTMLDSPFHRAQYRHTNFPDFLLPCRYQQQCTDRSKSHRMRFSHGEQVYYPKANQSINETGSLPLCKWGMECNHLDNNQHCQKFRHA